MHSFLPQCEEANPPVKEVEKDCAFFEQKGGPLFFAPVIQNCSRCGMERVKTRVAKSVPVLLPISSEAVGSRKQIKEGPQSVHLGPRGSQR